MKKAPAENLTAANGVGLAYRKSVLPHVNCTHGGYRPLKNEAQMKNTCKALVVKTPVKITSVPSIEAERLAHVEAINNAVLQLGKIEDLFDSICTLRNDAVKKLDSLSASYASLLEHHLGTSVLTIKEAANVIHSWANANGRHWPINEYAVGRLVRANRRLARS